MVIEISMIFLASRIMLSLNFQLFSVEPGFEMYKPQDSQVHEVNPLLVRSLCHFQAPLHFEV